MTKDDIEARIKHELAASKRRCTSERKIAIGGLTIAVADLAVGTALVFLKDITLSKAASIALTFTSASLAFWTAKRNADGARKTQEEFDKQREKPTLRLTLDHLRRTYQHGYDHLRSNAAIALVRIGTGAGAIWIDASTVIGHKFQPETVTGALEIATAGLSFAAASVSSFGGIQDLRSAWRNRQKMRSLDRLQAA